MQKNVNGLINEVYRHLFFYFKIRFVKYSYFQQLCLGPSCKKTFLSIKYTFGQMKTLQNNKLFTVFLLNAFFRLIYDTIVRNNNHCNCVLCSSQINCCSQGLFRIVLSKLHSWALLSVYKHSSYLSSQKG